MFLQENDVRSNLNEKETFINKFGTNEVSEPFFSGFVHNDINNRNIFSDDEEIDHYQDQSYKFQAYSEYFKKNQFKRKISSGNENMSKKNTICNVQLSSNDKISIQSNDDQISKSETINLYRKDFAQEQLYLKKNQNENANLEPKVPSCIQSNILEKKESLDFFLCDICVSIAGKFSYQNKSDSVKQHTCSYTSTKSKNSAIKNKFNSLTSSQFDDVSSLKTLTNCSNQRKKCKITHDIHKSYSKTFHNLTTGENDCFSSSLISSDTETTTFHNKPIASTQKIISEQKQQLHKKYTKNTRKQKNSKSSDETLWLISYPKVKSSYIFYKNLAEFVCIFKKYYDVICLTYQMAEKSASFLGKILMNTDIYGHYSYKISSIIQHQITGVFMIEESSAYEILFEKYKNIHFQNQLKLENLERTLKNLQKRIKSNSATKTKFQNESEKITFLLNIMNDNSLHGYYGVQSRTKNTIFKKILMVAKLASHQCEKNKALQSRLDNDLFRLNFDSCNMRFDAENKCTFVYLLDDVLEKNNESIIFNHNARDTHYESVNYDQKNFMLLANKFFKKRYIPLNNDLNRSKVESNNFIGFKTNLCFQNQSVLSKIENEKKLFDENTKLINVYYYELSKIFLKSGSKINKEFISCIEQKIDNITYIYLKYSKNILIQNHIFHALLIYFLKIIQKYFNIVIKY